MEWLSENWLWVLIAIAFAALHMFGHGGHGGHGGRDGDGGRTSREPSAKREEDRPAGHRH